MSKLTRQLLDAGNIVRQPFKPLLTEQPVDRKNKDNQKLFSGTFDVLKLGECVLVFPEFVSS